MSRIAIATQNRKVNRARREGIPAAETRAPMIQRRKNLQSGGVFSRDFPGTSLFETRKR
jgi:hypothetical protein